MHGSLNNFLKKVWMSSTTHSSMDMDKLADEIYFLYTPQPPRGVSQAWTQKTYHAIPLAEMAWRVYMSVKPHRLLWVWDRLQATFQSQHGLVAAKHTTVEAAAYRVDTLVVYLKGRTDVNAFITEIRKKFVPGSSVDGKPKIPPKFRADMFKKEIPATTAAIPGLPGISAAQQPLEDGWAEQDVAIPHLKSFGQQLSELVAAGYHGSKNSKDFIQKVETAFLKAGVDINRPWQSLLSQATRNQLVASGNAARRRRGKI